MGLCLAPRTDVHVTRLLSAHALSLSFVCSHPGYFGKVGMRHFHKTTQKYFCPTINVDKLWSLVSEQVGSTLSSIVACRVHALPPSMAKILCTDLFSFDSSTGGTPLFHRRAQRSEMQARSRSSTASRLVTTRFSVKGSSSSSR
jgi:hypothetical protein